MLVGFVVFNATLNNISVISWLSVLLVKYPDKSSTKRKLLYLKMVKQKILKEYSKQDEKNISIFTSLTSMVIQIFQLFI
jgi:hypothetical protein